MTLKRKIENTSNITGDDSLLDTTKLLRRYFNDAKSIKLDSNILYHKVKQCNTYISKLPENLGPFFDNEIELMNNIQSKLESTSLQLTKKFNSTTNPNEKNKIIKEISLEIENAEKAEVRFNAIHEALKETIVIIKPIYGKTIEIKKLVFKLKRTIIFYRIWNFLINTLLILAIAFLLNYLFDCIQNFTESQVSLSHFKILTISFFLQTFLITPFILNKLKSKLDWPLVRKLHVDLPELRLKLDAAKVEFNEKVSGWKQLNQFTI